MTPTLMAVAFTAGGLLVGQVQAWHRALPPCTAPFQPFVYKGCFQEQTLPFRSTLPSNNMTVEVCASECKGNSYRYALTHYFGFSPVVLERKKETIS